MVARTSPLQPELTARVDTHIPFSTLRDVRRIARERDGAGIHPANARRVEAEHRVRAYSLICRRHPTVAAGPMVRAVKRFFDPGVLA